MKIFRKVALLLAALMLLATLVACSSGGDGNGDANTNQPEDTNTPDNSGDTKDPIVLKFAGFAGEDHISTMKMKDVKAEVEEKTDGAVQIDIYPASALGEMNLIIQSLADGTIPLCSGYVDATYVPLTDAMNLGYIFSTYEQNAYMTQPGSNLYELLRQNFEDIGVELVGIHAEGLLGINTTRVPDNYNVAGANKNFLTRIPLSDTIKDAVTLMGYQTVSIVFADLYSSLQTGVCEGSYGQSACSVYTLFSDVAKYYIPYNCTPELIEYLVSPELYNMVSAEQAEIIVTAMQNAGKWMADNALDEELKYQGLLSDSGIEILPLTDEEIQAFADAEHETNWPKYVDVFGQEVFDAINADYENC